MKFYRRFVGDYASATMHLTMLQNGAYTLLLDAYYATRKPLPADRVFQIVRAFSPVERRATSSVLNEFWKLTPEGWINERAASEIDAYEERSETNRKIAQNRETKRNTSRSTKRDTKRSTKPAPTRARALGSGSLLVSPPVEGESEGAGPSFDVFWELWPKKDAKLAARKAWGKLSTAQRILAAGAVAEQVSTGKLDGSRFTPLPATWLNGHRWEDTPEPAPDRDERKAVADAAEREYEGYRREME